MKTVEQQLRDDARVQRLLKNPNWRPAAEAAIAFHVNGVDCPIDSWKKSSTWAQVTLFYNELVNKSGHERQ